MNCNIGACISSVGSMVNSSLLATSLCIILLVVLLPHPIVGVDVNVATSWSNALQARLNELEAQELMANEVISIINQFESLNPPERQSPDNVWVENLANDISALMDGKATLAKRLAEEVERLYNNRDDKETNVPVYDSLDQSTWDNAFRASLEHDDRYPVNISYTYSTVRHPDYARLHEAGATASSREARWSAPLDSYFRSLHSQDPKLESVYFASSSGYLRAFPGGPWVIKAPPNSPGSSSYNNNINNGFIFGDNDDDGQVKIAGFNAKFRPWYVLGASGPKDVVLVLDASTSMGSMYEVRKAAVNVVAGLTSQDYVNVVVFNTNAAISSCWQNRLVRATDANKHVITSYLMDLESATGKTNIEAGIELGLQLLDNSAHLNQSSRCSQVLLLLTDGVTSVTHFTIVNKDARLFAYVLNTYTDTSPLQRLTCANNGILIPVPNPSSAYVQMGSYYDVLSPGMASSAPVWVGPYLNQFTGSGLVMTVAYPCYDRSEDPPLLIGVVGVDVPMDHLEALSKNYVAHPSYTFIVNNVGEALVHPHLPLGANYKKEPKFFDIAELEGLIGNDEFDRIRRDMVHGITGSYQLNKTTHLSRGMHQHEGMQSWNSTVNYFYQRMHGDMSVAIAWTQLNSAEPDLLAPSLRARVTHLTPDAYHTSQQNADSHTSFSVAAKGYCDPVMFIETTEDEAFSNLVVASVDAPVNASCPLELLRSEARLAIQASSNIGGVWNSTFYALHPEVKVRFMATHHSGVMRTYPGHSFSAKYDPTGVDWYRRALASETDSLAVSVPQTHSDKHDVLSSFEEGKFNTIVFSRIVPYVTKDDQVTTYGVMGMSVDYSYISEIFLDSVNNSCSYNAIQQSRPSGTRCLWLDGNGYIITHRRFLFSLPPPNSSYIFIGNEEPLLADTLVSHGVMARVTSYDFSTGTKVRVNTFNFPKTAFKRHEASGVMYANGSLNALDCSQKGNYFISKVGATNTFLVVINITINSVCSYYNTPNRVTFEPQETSVCTDPLYYSTSGTCSARPLSFEEMESIRGIQNCRSETSAIILGILIPLGIGAALLCLIWLYRRRKRMSRETGMLVGNADLGNPDRVEHEHDNPSDPNHPNPNQMGADMDNVPSYVVDPHVNHETIVIRESNSHSSNNNSPRLSARNSNSSSNIANMMNNNGTNNSTTNSNRQSSSSSLALRTRRTTGLNSSSGLHSPSASPTSTTQPNLRNSIIFSQDSFTHNNSTPTLSPTLSISNPYSSNMYYTEGDEDIEGGRGIAMQPLSQSASLRHNHHQSDEESNGEEDNDENYNNNHHHQHHEMKEDEDDEEEEEEDSEGEGESGSEGEEGDPDDLFAGMAREMGIALPRTSGR